MRVHGTTLNLRGKRMWPGLAMSGVLTLAGAVAATVPATVAGAQSGLPTSPQVAQQLMAAVVRATASETAFTTKSTAVSGSNTFEMTTDSGVTGGLQFIDGRLQGQVMNVSIILIGPTVYVKGNVAGLQLYMSFKSAAARREAGA